MSMAIVNRTFAKALAGSTVTTDGCTMVWERGDDGVQRQRLTCVVTRQDGSKEHVTGLYDGRADLVAAAEKLAGEYITVENRKGAAPPVWDRADKVQP